MVVVQDCDEVGVDAAGGAYCARLKYKILLRAGTRHVTGCPGVVVVQECEEEGADVAGGAYCARLKYKFCYAQDATCDWFPWRGCGAGV
jgi:hypothetical protein